MPIKKSRCHPVLSHVGENNLKVKNNPTEINTSLYSFSFKDNNQLFLHIVPDD